MKQKYKTKSICLVSTFHDPKGKTSIIFLKKHINEIKTLFSCISLVITNNTSKLILDFLNQNNIPYIISPEKYGSLSRKIALNNALKTKLKYFFHIDFDRLLFWLEKFPIELFRTLIKIEALDINTYLVIGRTKQAWDTHPKIQQIPEEKTNKAISKKIKKKVDVTPGCRAFDQKIAQLIIKKSSAIKSGVSDTEWLMIAYTCGKSSIKTIKVNGLSYETQLIFGKDKTRFVGDYEYSRNQMADESIKVINQIKFESK